MPVKVVKKGGKKPYAIVEKATGRVVGRSATKQKASISAGHRNKAYGKKNFGKGLV